MTLSIPCTRFKVYRLYAVAELLVPLIIVILGASIHTHTHTHIHLISDSFPFVLFSVGIYISNVCGIVSRSLYQFTSYNVLHNAIALDAVNLVE